MSLFFINFKSIWHKKHGIELSKKCSSCYKLLLPCPTRLNPFRNEANKDLPTNKTYPSCDSIKN